MKLLNIAGIAAALSIALGSANAQTDKKDAKGGSAKKVQPSTIQPNVIPKDAVANPDGTYSYTDKNGKKWLYGNTPFGISKVEDMRGMNQGFAATPSEQLIKTTDNGETVKFERQTPFGPAKWEKKKSELTDEERRIYEQQHPQPPPETQQQPEQQPKP